MDEHLEILLDTENAHLRFQFPSQSVSPLGSLIDGTCFVAKGPLRLEYSFVCFGYDLEHFSSELRQLHATLEGKAQFNNQEGNVEVAVFVADRAHGRLGVSVSMHVEVPELGSHRINLSGFNMDQSHVPECVSALGRFLYCTNVSRVHPMVRDTP
jgi:hypothetical protein